MRQTVLRLLALTVTMTVANAPLSAQLTDPEQVALQYTEAMRAGDWTQMAELMHPEALLERGNIRHLKGDRDGARADWLKIIETSPDAPVAAAARLNLERMDFKPR